MKKKWIAAALALVLALSGCAASGNHFGQKQQGVEGNAYSPRHGAAPAPDFRGFGIAPPQTGMNQQTNHIKCTSFFQIQQ